VQALSDDQKLIKPEEIRSILNLTQNQIQAARPLTELSSTRTLSLSEYRLAEEELGLSLQNLLELETAARAATLRALYREEPKLFTEHKARNNPKAINALIDAYGSSFPDEIRAILKSNDLSDGQALRLLEGLKSALTEGDLEKSKNFQKQLEGTNLEAWAKDAIPLAFIRMNTADTALGRKLASGLSARDNAFILSALRQPPPRESQMLKAFQEIARVMDAQHISYDEARDRWLNDGGVSVKTKARFLGMSLNSKEFNLLFSQIPEAQRKEVEDAIDEFSSFRVFARSHHKPESREVEKPNAKPGILQRLLGRVETAVRSELVPVLPENLKVESFEFVSAPIPAEGLKFMMGSPPNEEGRDNDETQREVTITKPFQYGVTTVTQWQWEEIMGQNPSRFKDGVESRNRPVEKVSWEDAQNDFIQKLNQRDSKWDYRLPTEAESELMTRAGTTTSYSHGNDIADLELHSYFSTNSGDKTHPVAEKRPNPWGIYDAHGNVWEWVSDWYSGTLLGGVDPTGPSTGSARVVRGGSWSGDAQFLRSAERSSGHPGLRSGHVGFRLVRTPKVLP
jgi:formylglycine-generating enzyme required for sulfatase activity